MVVGDRPVFSAVSLSDIDRLRRSARNCSGSVLPAARPVRRKSSAAIAAISVGTEPIPFSSGLIIWASTPIRSGRVRSDQPDARRALRSSCIRI